VNELRMTGIDKDNCTKNLAI